MTCRWSSRKSPTEIEVGSLKRGFDIRPRILRDTIYFLLQAPNTHEIGCSKQVSSAAGAGADIKTFDSFDNTSWNSHQIVYANAQMALRDLCQWFLEAVQQNTCCSAMFLWKALCWTIICFKCIYIYIYTYYTYITRISHIYYTYTYTYVCMHMFVKTLPHHACLTFPNPIYFEQSLVWKIGLISGFSASLFFEAELHHPRHGDDANHAKSRFGPASSAS